MTAIIQPRPVPPLTPPRLVPPLSVAGHELDTGLKVLAVECGGAPLVQLRLWVPFACSSETDTARATLLAGTLLSGTQRRSNAELAAALQALGATLRIGADPDRLLFMGQALASGLPDLLELLAEVLTSAAYPEDNVAKERGRIMEELKLAWSAPWVLASEALRRRMFGTHPYACEVPEPGQLAKMGPDDVRRLHAERVLPGGSTLVLVGDVPAEQGLAQATEVLSCWNAPGSTPVAPAVPPLEPGPVLLVNRPGLVQSSIRIGGPALPRSDPDYAALKLAKTVFGGYLASRLVENIREDKGYAYSPQCVIQHSTAGSTLQLEADVASEVTAPALLEIGYELGRMATLPVSADELENARQYAIGTLALATATQGDLADKIVALDASGFGPDWLQEHPRHLAAVTVEQVLEQAARFLAPTRLVTVVLGDANLIEPSMRTLSEVTHA